MSNNKLKKRQARLFSTLASIEQTDASATKRRKQSQLHSLQQSRAASDQTKINGILLELRILTQRCLTEESSASATDADEGTLHDNGAGSRVKEEVDALLENLLVARRELMGHELDGDESPKKDVDYAKLIQQTEEDETSSDDSSTNSSSSKDGSTNNLTKQIQSEYTSLRNNWKSTLNNHHSNLALHSGMSVNSSKFQSRAVDVSFWEQVQGGMEHDRFKQRTSSSNNNSNNDQEDSILQFDDSKLYQQMLKDFISSSQTTGTSSSKANKRGIMMDPAQEAAERLKRAMRKKSGTGGDVDLTSLLTEGDTTNADIVAKQNAARKKAATVDRRASKGRKIRYTVNPKLVNFTFPVSRPEPMIKEDVWFKSLFGGVGRV